MTTREKWLAGILLLVVAAFIFMAFKKPKEKVKEVIDPKGGTVQCKENDPGYEIDGTLNPLCGSPKCDPNNYGYNLSGFPDLDCGFGGRKAR